MVIILKWQECRVIGQITQQNKNLKAHVILNKRKLLYIKTSVSEVQNTWSSSEFIHMAVNAARRSEDGFWFNSWGCKFEICQAKQQ